jgi:hypothetical protein
MPVPKFALAAVVGLGLMMSPLADAATATPPKAPDVGKAATEYVEQIKVAPVCTLEDGSTTSYSCTTLDFGTPLSFRCVVTNGSIVCAVPLVPESPPVGVGIGTPTGPATPTGK